MLISRALGIVVSLFLCTVALGQQQKPNFIVVMADDLGFGDLGIYGASLIDTPNLDRMAAEGIYFDSFYASANVCTASRGGLLTGRYPVRLDLVSDVARPTNDIHLAESEITIAEALKEQGYSTAIFGKWHLGSRIEWYPLRHGFDEFFGALHSNDMPEFRLYRDDQVIEDPVDQTTLTERYTAESLRFIEDNQDQPFFLYIPHSFPHVPLFVSNQFEGKSDAGLYGDVVETIDWSMGMIFDKLQELGLDDNTLVVFTSDNGPWFEGSSGQYRDRKGSSWEGGLRVPFIARWPGTIPAGSHSTEPAMNIDILPTVLDFAGVDLPANRAIDGLSLKGMLTQAQVSPHEVIYLFNNDRIAGVRKGRWKLVVESFYRGALPSFDNPNSYYGPNGLLFDLEKDPSETYSYTRENPDVVEELRAHLIQGQQDLNSAVLPNMWNR
ncbi:MAG: sulfatase-like hydrolase/transferase [Pseudomonadales bacterium]|nr:sulfatase-like hydrolase/transferase [Pseudomonadales bacterium]